MIILYPLKKTRRYIIDWSDLFITENEYDYEKHNGLDHNHCVDAVSYTHLTLPTIA